MNGRNTKPLLIHGCFNKKVTVTSEKLGESFFSTVYKGSLCQGKKKSTIAIKAPKKYLPEEKVILEFIKSLNNNTLGKNFIIAYLGTITFNQRLAFIFEYANAGSLCEWIPPKNNHYNVKACLDIANHTAKGLFFLHEQYILHRDINPSNILLKGEPHSPKAMIADFGFSTSMANRPQGIVGAIAYHAPELLTPKNYHFSINGHTFATDIFSFGMTMAAMILRDENPSHLSPSNNDQTQKLINAFNDIKKTLHEGKNNSRFGHLIPITFWCMEHRAKDRPRAQDLVRELDKKNEHGELSPRFFNYITGTPNQEDIVDLLIERVHDFRFT